MGKHIYCIIAHHNWWQLKVLLRLLDDKRNDIFIHIDKKVKVYDIESIVGVCKESVVRVYQEVVGYWGTYSLVQCELSLFRHAYLEREKNANEGVVYYHLLSGVDLPLRNQDTIHAFFDSHCITDYIRFDDNYSKTSKCIDRVRYYYFFRGHWSTKWVRFPIYLDAGLRVIQKLINIDRWSKCPLTLYYGSQWASLSEESIKILIQNEQIIRKYFNSSICPDELYKQTILRNSGASFFSMNVECAKSCLRYIDFSANQASPKTLTMDDFDRFMNSGAFFARKFDENIDREIIKKVYRVVSGKEYSDSE